MWVNDDEVKSKTLDELTDLAIRSSLQRVINGLGREIDTVVLRLLSK